MQRIVLTALVLFASAAPVLAQSAQGNWACRDTEAADAGILTIYGEVYGFASTGYGDPASGTGTLAVYTDGVGFQSGSLREERGIEAGRLVSDQDNGRAIQLETAEAIAMLCTPMRP